MDTDDLASMYAQIVRGGTKEQSRYVSENDPETGELWDKIAAEVAAIRQGNPDAQFAVPNEVPSPGSVSDLPGGLVEPDPVEDPDAEKSKAKPTETEAPPEDPEADPPEDEPEKPPFGKPAAKPDPQEEE